MSDITKQEYVGLSDAYNFFNRELFSGKLPGCLITIQSRSRNRAAAYFSARQFINRIEEKETDEISLNAEPDKI